MSWGLTFEKLLLIGLIAVILIGPDRLPGYAAQFGRLVRSLRDMANGAKTRMREEMGPDYDDVDSLPFTPGFQGGGIPTKPAGTVFDTFTAAVAPIFFARPSR